MSEAPGSRSEAPGASKPPGVQRIKTRNQFQAVMAGQTVSRTAHFALHRVTLSSPATADDASTGPGSARPEALFVVQAPWIGAVLPKRWAKRAVTRNTIKRQIYAVVHEFAASLPSAAHVVRLRSTFDRAQFISATSDALKRAVRAELQALFRGARR